ncbi:MAG: hypothetical protein ACYCWE_21530 [Eubacteriales bacterium]
MNADNKKAQNNSAFDKSNKIIILTAISLIPGSFLYGFIVSFKFSLLFAILFPLIMVYTGYGIQILMSNLVFYNNNDDNYDEFLNIRTLLPHQIFNLVISVLMYILTNYYLLKLSIEYKYSSIPLLLCIFSFICILAGIVLWFFPQKVLISKNFIIKCMFIIFIGYMVTVMFGINETIPISSLLLNPINFIVLLFNGGRVNLYAIITAIIYLILAYIANIRNRRYYNIKIQKKHRRGKYDYDI